MKNYEEWIRDYARDHQNPINILIHKICVPLILWSVVALLVSLPVHWNTLYLMVPAFLFWLLLNPIIGFLTIIQVIVFAMTAEFIKVKLEGPLVAIALGVFVLAWIGQFYGHKIEGKKPSFLTDLLYLFVGPMWTIHTLFRGPIKIDDQ